MGTSLSAVVVGAGWAGEGHTRALQWCGVEVAAICARQPDVVRQVADRLVVPEASTDWRATIERIKPDIVAIATPASLRREVVEVAAALGCHLLCDKPLAATAGEAAQLYQLAKSAGVKHAYASTHRYDPSVAYLAELVCDGAVGRVGEVVFTARANLPPLLPWTWALNADAGGGWLNNGFTHTLGILCRIVGGEPLRAMGRVQNRSGTAPVVPAMHDFRQMLATAQGLTPETVKDLERLPYETDMGFSALVEFTSPLDTIPVTAKLGPGAPAPGEVNGYRLCGEAGTLRADGSFQLTLSRLRAGSDELEPLPVPQRLLREQPQVGDDVQNKWCALARDFVADIRGEPHQPYLTFRDGWRYQAVIDAIRSGAGWTELPAEPSPAASEPAASLAAKAAG